MVEDTLITYQEAMASVDSIFQKEAIDNKHNSITSNDHWILTSLPSGSKPLGYKWIFREKLRPNGFIEKFKTRLVAKRFKQQEGLNYFDTYSHVTRTTTIRTLIAIASAFNLEIHQMDVKAAFLNGDLEDEIYIKKLEGFVVPG